MRFRPISGRRWHRPAAVTTVLAPLLLLGIAIAAEPAAVEVAPTQVSDSAETLRLTGTVTAERRAGLSPRVSGLVAEVHVDAGDRVAEGEVLLELDRTFAELAQQRADAGLQEARAQLGETQRLQREASQLVKDRHIAETEGRSRDANVKLQAAVVARLEAEARDAAERVKRHALIAPFAGVISSRQTEAGEWVETGTAVLELVGTESLRLDVRAPQERFADIDAATPVTVRLVGASGRELPGRVVAKVPVNDPTARTFLVRVTVEDAGTEMIPGMSADAVFHLRGEQPALQVPRDALVRGADGQDRVWIIDRSNGSARAMPRIVTVGKSLGETVEIVDGLDTAQPVVIRGNEGLREGQTVRILGED